MKHDRAAVERAVAALLASLGLSAASEPELERTPARVADFYAEAFSGLDPASLPDLVTFPHAGEDLVMVRGIRFHSICLHHLAPFFGRADVAYIPAGRIVGASAPARLLDHYSRRPQLQERITTQIADHLERLAQPRGVAVRLTARHLCMEMRGVRRAARFETRVVRGTLTEPAWAARLGF